MFILVESQVLNNQYKYSICSLKMYILSQSKWAEHSNRAEHHITSRFKKYMSTLVLTYLFICIKCKHSTLNMNVGLLVKGMSRIYKTAATVKSLAAVLVVNAE